MANKNTYKEGPDSSGNFGNFGGRYVAETLMQIHDKRQMALAHTNLASVQLERDEFSRDYIGRESPLYFAERLTEYAGGAKIYFETG